MRSTTDAAAPARVWFTETMTGHVALGETDPRQGERRGRAEGTTLTFQLTITFDDVRRLVAEPARQAMAAGWVECDALGGRLPVQDGAFHLSVAEGLRTGHMRYRLHFHDAAGHRLTLQASKELHDDRGADVWPDTTTLFTRILLGHAGLAGDPDDPDDPGPTVTGAGVLRMRPLDFARQLTTLRASGPDLRARGAALATFGSFFLGQLRRVYVPVTTRRQT